MKKLLNNLVTLISPPPIQIKPTAENNKNYLPPPTYPYKFSAVKEGEMIMSPVQDRQVISYNNVKLLVAKDGRMKIKGDELSFDGMILECIFMNDNNFKIALRLDNDNYEIMELWFTSKKEDSNLTEWIPIIYDAFFYRIQRFKNELKTCIGNLKMKEIPNDSSSSGREQLLSTAVNEMKSYLCKYSLQKLTYRENVNNNKNTAITKTIKVMKVNRDEIDNLPSGFFILTSIKGNKYLINDEHEKWFYHIYNEHCKSDVWKSKLNKFEQFNSKWSIGLSIKHMMSCEIFYIPEKRTLETITCKGGVKNDYIIERVSIAHDKEHIYNVIFYVKMMERNDLILKLYTKINKSNFERSLQSFMIIDYYVIDFVLRCILSELEVRNIFFVYTSTTSNNKVQKSLTLQQVYELLLMSKTNVRHVLSNQTTYSVGILKKLVIQLLQISPHPIIPFEFHEKFIKLGLEISNHTSTTRQDFVDVKTFIIQLPPVQREIIENLCFHIHRLTVDCCLPGKKYFNELKCDIHRNKKLQLLVAVKSKKDDSNSDDELSCSDEVAINTIYDQNSKTTENLTNDKTDKSAILIKKFKIHHNEFSLWINVIKHLFRLNDFGADEEEENENMRSICVVLRIYQTIYVQFAAGHVKRIHDKFRQWELEQICRMQ